MTFPLGRYKNSFIPHAGHNQASNPPTASIRLSLRSLVDQPVAAVTSGTADAEVSFVRNEKTTACKTVGQGIPHLTWRGSRPSGSYRARSPGPHPQGTELVSSPSGHFSLAPRQLLSMRHHSRHTNSSLQL